MAELKNHRIIEKPLFFLFFSLRLPSNNLKINSLPLLFFSPLAILLAFIVM